MSTNKNTRLLDGSRLRYGTFIEQTKTIHTKNNHFAIVWVPEGKLNREIIDNIPDGSLITVPPLGPGLEETKVLLAAENGESLFFTTYLNKNYGIMLEQSAQSISSAKLGETKARIDASTAKRGMLQDFKETRSVIEEAKGGENKKRNRFGDE